MKYIEIGEYYYYVVNELLLLLKDEKTKMNQEMERWNDEQNQYKNVDFGKMKKKKVQPEMERRKIEMK